MAFLRLPIITAVGASQLSSQNVAIFAHEATLLYRQTYANCVIINATCMGRREETKQRDLFPVAGSGVRTN
jgi:hypothetical protein